MARPTPMISPNSYANSSEFLARFGLLEEFLKFKVHTFYNTDLNVVDLCPNCEKGFSDPIDQWYYFFPADLEYFIRVIPDREQYRQAQIASGAISPDDRSGLYTRLLFHTTPYVPDPHPKPWPGPPILAILRAMGILASPRIRVVPKETVKQLETLRDLYFYDDEDLPTVAPPLSFEMLCKGQGNWSGPPTDSEDSDTEETLPS
ncbi:hypothetical protein BO70DRAFT_395461 [Aspergillus heteromorphus CBS 117.55]|uniref:Uncharacterized protein n=1 Tax=Aspergillus heteromorphus CBS 117.55 TaxID=1448321 RepID=A0A317WI93_9EURO|nr:uncharacterized protein BO70DRAFT_395461 [Aspergillus heteromorphus CBS 117.55]PWY84778.1 hypothetical protein BO70DRAFT_395461 [Aspergillus heteromorphus CBS 117.55]